MTRLLLLTGVLAFAFASGCSPKPAPATTSEATAPAASEPASADTTAEIDPVAISALEKMTGYLGTLKTFEVTTRTTVDQVLDSGQKIQMDGGATYRVQRPNAFFIETRSDRRLRQFFYNGKTFTIFSPRMGFYAEAPAPATIADVLQKLEDDYDISIPLNDLFHWGSNPDDVKKITSATPVGYAKIGDADCDQYAFRQADVDWQIWIERGDRTLPRKVVITTTDDDAQPQYVAYIDWNLAPKFDAATFNFTPPKDASKIEIKPVAIAAN